MNTEPPAPPSPPSGPPRGTYFSRRKLQAPRPPSPPLTYSTTRSTNIGIQSEKRRSQAQGLRPLGPASRIPLSLLYLIGTRPRRDLLMMPSSRPHPGPDKLPSGGRAQGAHGKAAARSRFRPQLFG